MPDLKDEVRQALANVEKAREMYDFAAKKLRAAQAVMQQAQDEFDAAESILSINNRALNLLVVRKLFDL
jgi:hypothetical protein